MIENSWELDVGSAHVCNATLLSCAKSPQATRTCICVTTLQQMGPFGLEKIDTQEILSQAKGSEGLLRLIG